MVNIMGLDLTPVGFREACAFIALHHRHHQPPNGYKFAIGVMDEGKVLCGVITVGRPVSRHMDNGWTAEATRCCTDGSKNACSMLYAAAWRASRAMGYRRLITYVLKEEPGTSLKAAGWESLYQTAGGSWNVPSRPRIDKHPLGQKTLWAISEEDNVS
jgi:hypothetical protein